MTKITKFITGSPSIIYMYVSISAKLRFTLLLYNYLLVPYFNVILFSVYYIHINSE